MIKRKTVLVLGAGASKPYGFPLASGLRDLIRDYDRFPKSDSHLGLFAYCGVPREALLELGSAFRGSGYGSIDAYLERHADLLEAGKLAIARELCLKENPKEVIGQANDHWYEHLWKYLSDGVREPMELQNNPIRILTFNYDRSLEYFLFTATRSLFRISDDEALAAIRKLEIIHLYGQLGPFHYKDTDEACTYNLDLDLRRLRMAAEGLKIISDARGNDQPFAEAAWFDWAEDICFLGFGFDGTNCHRLGLAEISERRVRVGTAAAIYANFVGRTQAEIETARLRICSTFRWVVLEHSNLQALRETTLFH